MVEDAISRLGFDKQPDLYRRIDAAVAFIVLERAEQRLPQWSAIRDDELILARKHRGASKIPNRKVVLQPRHMFTINWADSPSTTLLGFHTMIVRSSRLRLIVPTAISRANAARH